MKYLLAPTGVRSLEQRIRNVAGDTESALRHRITMALVVVGQMLPEGAIKGGGAMALRYGNSSRFTKDVDVVHESSLSKFREDFEESLHSGWAGFSGRLIKQKVPTPDSVPAAYVMQPFDVKLSYLNQPWCTVRFELALDEFSSGITPEFHIANDLIALFAGVGLTTPEPVPTLRAEHQIAQKLHALSEPGSLRARDLVDLQLLLAHEMINFHDTHTACLRIFNLRKRHSWPPVVASGDGWDRLYSSARQDTCTLHSIDEAIAWVNQLIDRIDSSSSG